jgi:hypothetical protein
MEEASPLVNSLENYKRLLILQSVQLPLEVQGSLHSFMLSDTKVHKVGQYTFLEVE